MAISKKHLMFANEYLKDLNATAAYKRAGYTAKGNAAEVNAARLLRHAQVAKIVQAAMDARSKRTKIDADYVLTGIKNTIERCAQEVPVLDKDGNQTGEYKFDSGAVLKGYELLGKHLKLFTDKVELSGKLSFREWLTQQTGSPTAS